MNPKYDGYQRRLASMIYNFLIRNLLVVLLKVKFMSNQELAEEIHKPIIRKFEKRKVY